MSSDLDMSSIRGKLTSPGDSMPVFRVFSLSQYCELTDTIRQLWSKKANKRFPGPKGYVGEILPWFRGAKDATHTLTPSLARDWKKYHKFYFYSTLFFTQNTKFIYCKLALKLHYSF